MSKYVVVLMSDAQSFNFDDFKDSNISTVREKNDGTYCILEYEGSMPSVLKAISPALTELTHVEAKALMETSEWVGENELDGV